MRSHFCIRRWICRALIIMTILPNLLLGRPAIADETSDQPAQILIEEISWAGSSLSQADEWIELANLGTATATIGGWSLQGAAALPIFIPSDTTLPPHGTYRIANYPETDEKSALMPFIQLATTTISLSNSALSLTLHDASGIVMDRAGNNATPLAGSSSPKATMIRIATSSGDLIEHWMSATSSVGFKPDITDFGAPGICHLCLLSPHSLSDDPDPDEPTTTSTSNIPSDPPSETPTSTTPEPPVTTPTSTGEIPTTDNRQPTPPPPPLHYVLSEAVSNPASGPEWIELRVAELNATSTDRTLELWDASGRIATITAHTAFTAPGYLVVSLASARLNNGGDDLSLRETTGITLEQTHIPALEDGLSWAKTETGSWLETDQLTPGGVNRFPAPVTTPPPPITTTDKQETKTTTKTTDKKAEPDHTTTSTGTMPESPDGPRLTILLNEAMSNPTDGKEWVELRFFEATATATDRLLELHDASGKIGTIPQGTTVASPGYLLFNLASARLNNDGDKLSLHEADGNLIDAMEIPALKKGIAWARDDDDQWIDTDQPSPGAPNQISEAATEQELIEEDSQTNTTAGPADSFIDFEHDMPQEALVSTRVRLVGTVGSVPRLLGATHAFILLGEDGRAAIVYLPKHLHTPSFGSTVRAMGTLTATERQLELRMKTSDVWMTVATSTPPRPREIDFLAPSLEDAWGLVTATGTIKSVASKSFVIDAEGVDVTVSVPTAAGYRPQRLAKGDVVRVTGLLDPRKETSTVVVRVPEDITLVKHAEESIATPAPEEKKGLPDWTPFGAAAGAVAMTGGFQRLRAFLKRRKLETMAAQTRMPS